MGGGEMIWIKETHPGECEKQQQLPSPSAEGVGVSLGWARTCLLVSQCIVGGSTRYHTFLPPPKPRRWAWLHATSSDTCRCTLCLHFHIPISCLVRLYPPNPELGERLMANGDPYSYQSGVYIWLQMFVLEQWLSFFWPMYPIEDSFICPAKNPFKPKRIASQFFNLDSIFRSIRV